MFFDFVFFLLILLLRRFIVVVEVDFGNVKFLWFLMLKILMDRIICCLVVFDLIWIKFVDEIIFVVEGRS